MGEERGEGIGGAAAQWACVHALHHAEVEGRVVYAVHGPLLLCFVTALACSCGGRVPATPRQFLPSRPHAGTNTRVVRVGR